MTTQKQFEQREIPRKALFFRTAPGESISVDTESADGQPVEKLKMRIYSGFPITGHWWWGTCAIDLSGGRYESDRYPILRDHDTERIIGSTGRPIVSADGLWVDPDTTIFCDTPDSQEFRARSKEKFPFQASIHFEPLKIEDLEKGAFSSVNGYTLEGPAHIIREWVFKEGSACVFGWDSHTESAAMSNEGDKLLLNIEVSRNQQKPHQKNGENSMAEVTITTGDANAQSENPPPQNDAPKDEGGKYGSIEEARAAIDAAYKQFPELRDEAKSKEGGEDKPAENKEMADAPDDKKKEEMTRDIEGLKKELAQQKMAAAQEYAEQSVALAMSQIEIPGKTAEECRKNADILKGKLSKLVPFRSYFNNGVFDKTAFSTAIAKEAKELTDLMPAVSGSAILGFGAMSQGSPKEAEDNATIERLFRMSQSGKRPVADDSLRSFMSALMTAAKQSGIGG